MKVKSLYSVILFSFCFSFSKAQTAVTLSITNGGGQDTYSATGPVACLSSGGPAPYQDPALKVGKIGSAVCRFNSFIQFNGVLNTGVIPENAVITKAELHIYRITGQDIGANDNSQSLYLLSESWTDQTVSNINFPGELFPATGYPMPINVPAGTIGQWTTINVLSHVDFMHCRKINFGWGIRMNYTTGTKNVRYASFEHATLKPYLEIEYYIPMSTVFSTHPSSSPVTPDATITVNVSGGSQSFTASWFDLNGTPLTNVTNTNVPAGLVTTLHTVLHGGYLLQVTDNNSGETRRMIGLVGTNGGETTVELQPDALWGNDAKIFSGPVFTTGFNYISNGNFGTDLIFGSSSGFIFSEGRGIIDFEYDGLTNEQYTIEQADLVLTGLSSNTHSGTNQSFLKRITEEWEEECVTWVTQPTTVTTNQITIPTLTASQGITTSILEFAKYWLEHPDEKYGMMLQLNSTVGFPNPVMNFGSSDQTTSANRPKLILKFRHRNQYAELKRKPDGGYYQVKSNILNFQFVDNYSDQDNKLSFKIINPLLPVATQVVYSDTDITLDPDYGENRFTVDCGCTGAALDKGFYILEVTNSKNEKSYLRIYQPEDLNCN